MTAKVDLRPTGVKIAEIKKVDLPRLVALVLILVFVVVSSFTTAYGIFVLKRLTAERQALEASVQRLTLESKKLDGYLVETTGQLDHYGKALALLREDTPSIEFFSAATAALPANVWLSQVKMAPGRADVEGFAFAENDIAAFALKLLTASVVDSISPLVTSKETKRDGNREETLVKFGFSCNVKDLIGMLEVAEGAKKDEIKR